MITINDALPNEFNIISDIAHKTWPVTYSDILTNFQLEYMLAKFYSIGALNENLQNGHCFLLAKDGDQYVGFAAYVHDYPTIGVTKIPKIYVLPETQGKGIGRLLINEVIERAVKNNSERITLNVNRKNNAQHFYRKLGFETIAAEDIDLGANVVQEDYIMEKPLP